MYRLSPSFKTFVSSVVKKLPVRRIAHWSTWTSTLLLLTTVAAADEPVGQAPPDAAVQTPPPSTSTFPQIYNNDKDPTAQPMSAEKAAATMKLPEGFTCSVFAAEPDVQNPIAMTWDGRGRLWIAENYTYADRKMRFDLSLKDRVICLEDSDNDGKADKRTVFTDQVQMLTSIEYGHGGVWLMCPPQLLFIPDADRDDVPDGPPQVVLDGFTVAEANYHNFANGLRWGPDGWLYGRCGGSCPGEIGVPGTAAENRAPLRGGIWRYHPTRKTVEVLCSGTTNPWGNDWNEEGELFFINTVNGHLWHMIPGAHYTRPFTLDPRPYVYELIDQHADHYHFDTGQAWHAQRDGKANDLGGGHAHQGCAIYHAPIDKDAPGVWPEEYHGRLFTNNLHGRRLNVERLDREGSGYVGRHEPDFMLAEDPFYRGLDMRFGPDGQMYLIDWSDTGECHEHDGVHRTSGRVYRIAYEGAASGPSVADLRDPNVWTIADRFDARNRWFRTQALIMQSEKEFRTGFWPLVMFLSTSAGSQNPNSITSDDLFRLHNLLGQTEPDGVTLEPNPPEIELPSDAKTGGPHPIDQLPPLATRLFYDRLLHRIDSPLGPTKSQVKMNVTHQVASQHLDMILNANQEPFDIWASAAHRLVLASTLQRLPIRLRGRLANSLVSYTEDANDHNLPLMVWYGLIPVAEHHPEQLVGVVAACTWPRTGRLITRRLTEMIEDNPKPLEGVIDVAIENADKREWVIAGLEQGLEGIRKATPPSNWDAFTKAVAESSDEKLIAKVQELSVVFGDGRAMEAVRKIALNGDGDHASRAAALQTLIDSRDEQLREICEKLLNDARINVQAASGLSLFDDPEIADALIKSYNRFRSPQRPKVIALLSSRPSFGHQLMAAMDRGRIPRDHLSAYQVRQMNAFGDDELAEKIRSTWGEIRESSAERTAKVEHLKESLTAAVLSKADLSHGRALFAKSCGKCHQLFGDGGKIGPILTGANRTNMHYLTENIIDPSAVVSKDFRMSVLILADGRVLSGLVTESTDRIVKLETPTETYVIATEDIEEREITPQSPMPEGLLDQLSEDDIRDLFAYLQSPSQVPLPAAE